MKFYRLLLVLGVLIALSASAHAAERSQPLSSPEDVPGYVYSGPPVWVTFVMAWERQDLALKYVGALEEAKLSGRWMAVHNCEQPDGWTAQGVFGNGLAGGGGLGISNAAWSEQGGSEFASVPGLATPLQQMIVAQRIYDRFGSSAWGCPVP